MSLIRVFNLLRCFEDNYNQAICQFSRERPDLVHLNKTFAEMYYLPPAECQERYELLGLPSLEICLKIPEETVEN